MTSPEAQPRTVLAVATDAGWVRRHVRSLAHDVDVRFMPAGADLQPHGERVLVWGGDWGKVEEAFGDRYGPGDAGTAVLWGRTAVMLLRASAKPRPKERSDAHTHLGWALSVARGAPQTMLLDHTCRHRNELGVRCGQPVVRWGPKGYGECRNCMR